LPGGHGLVLQNPHRACRDACTTTSPALGPGGAAAKEEAVNTHSNARFGGEVEWNVSGDNDFFGSAVSSWNGSAVTDDTVPKAEPAIRNWSFSTVSKNFAPKLVHRTDYAFWRISQVQNATIR
jgi:hypothetical protein